jgi:hypothetical protein
MRPKVGSLDNCRKRLMKFTYVDVVGKGCDGWINLFFGDECIALINDPVQAAEMKKVIEPYHKGEK